MLSLTSLYAPIVSRPFLHSEAYAEFSPCEFLKPFIRCYWGTFSSLSHSGEKVLVIPDTCMDMIIEVNHTTGRMTGMFSSIQDQPFFSMREQHASEVVSRFAVRFHFWAVHLFTNYVFRDSANQSLPLEEIFPDWRTAFQPFFQLPSIQDRIGIAEEYLLGRLHQGQMNDSFLNAVYRMLETSGAQSIQEICSYTTVSQRQLERLFQSKVGFSLKKTSRLIRYQNVWREMALSNSFHVHEAVEKYGYTDQSHLLHEFKRFHGVAPTQALHIASQSRS